MNFIENKLQKPLPNNQFNNICITCKIKLDETEQFSIHEVIPRIHPPITFFEGLKQLITSFAQFSINQVPQNACHSCLINTVGFLRFQTICNQTVESIKSYIKQQESTSSALRALLEQPPASSVTYDGLPDKDLDTSDEDHYNDIDDEERGANEQSTENEEKQQSEDEDEEFIPLSVLKRRYSTRLSSEIATNDQDVLLVDENLDTKNQLEDFLIDENLDMPTKTETESKDQSLKTLEVLPVQQSEKIDHRALESIKNEFDSIKFLDQCDQSTNSVVQNVLVDENLDMNDDHDDIPIDNSDVLENEAKGTKEQSTESETEESSSDDVSSSEHDKEFKRNIKTKKTPAKTRGEGHQSLLCSVCGKAFNSRKYYSVHIQGHNDTLDHLCSVCGKGFKSKTCLYQHSRHHMATTQICEICGKTLKNAESYKWHMATHNPAFECPECGKKYITRIRLETHMDSHNGIKRFECSFCGKKFTHRSGRIQHEDRHCKVRKSVRQIEGIEGETMLPIKRFPCSYCPKKFSYNQGRRQHEMKYCKVRRGEKQIDDMESEGEATHECRYCGKIFQQKQSWLKHEAAHRKVRRGVKIIEGGQLCSVCNKQFRTKSELKIHTERKHSVTFDYTCPEPECGRRFKGKLLLKNHMRDHREEFRTCEICGHVFDNGEGYSAYAMHKLKEHTEEERKTNKERKKNQERKENTECDHCGKMFRCVSALKAHIDSHNGIKRFECADCGMKFARKRGKQDHEAWHCRGRKAEMQDNGEKMDDEDNEDNEESDKRKAPERSSTNLEWGKRQVSCKYCHKSFRRDKIRDHEARHEGAQYECKVCGKTFSNRHCHYTHIQLHKETCDYLCSECGKAFKSSMLLGNHIARVHRKRIPKTCEVCGKVSTNAATHNLHMEMHGEPKYACELCDKKFYHISSLKRHSNIHTGIKRFECTYCGKQFEHKHTFDKHVARYCKVLKSGGQINTNDDVDDVDDVSLT